MYEVPMLELILVQVEDGFAYSESGAFDDEYGDIVTPPMQWTLIQSYILILQDTWKESFTLASIL